MDDESVGGTAAANFHPTAPAHVQLAKSGKELSEVVAREREATS